MRVETIYSDSSGTYRIRADVRENNRAIHVIDIIDNDYNTEADWDDFTEEEQGTIQNLLLEEYDDLDKDSKDDYTTEDDDESGDDFDTLPSDY